MAEPEVAVLADVGRARSNQPDAIDASDARMTPSGRVQDTLRSLENASARAPKRVTARTTRVSSVGNEGERVDEVKSRSSVETAKSMMQRVLEMLAKMGNEMVDLKHRVSEQSDTIRKLSATVYKQSTIIQGQEDLIRGLEREVAALKEQLAQLTQKLNASGEVTLSSGARATFADIARTLPASPPTSLSSVAVPRKQQTASDPLHCTIDTSRAIETEMRAMNGQETWRDEAELQMVKEAAQKTAVEGSRVMRDQLYPVRVDNANRTAILTRKISWLSKRESGKAYGRSVTKHMHARSSGHAASAQRLGITTESAQQLSQNASRVADRTSRSAGSLNAHKSDVVQQSLMNDAGLKDFAVLALSEPSGAPTRGEEVMVVSVYVQGKNDEALTSAMELLHDLIDRFRDGTGNRTDVVLAGDFNRHDLLWGGDEVSASRQGEGQPIIDLMNDFGLSSLLPRGTKTWQRADEESTIDLVLASAELADEVISCMTHPTDHGSDHRAIQTAFDIQVPERTFPQRLMLKNAPWIAIATRVEDELRPLPWSPPPYAKRWWTKDLTRLRQTYTYWRNQARAQRRAGQPQPDLEQRAKDAAKEYHDNVRKQKKSHWDDFVTDENNIWKVVKYLKPGVNVFDDKVPPLRRADGSITKGKGEQGEELLSTFFPPLPTMIEPEGDGGQVLKAPGEDGLPVIVWKKLWHVVKHRVWTLFDSSLREGVVPHQWRTAKIIPLKKPVVAERISYAVEAHGLLPANHFGARKRRSADQALVLLQERIYKAWRMGRVLSLVSFDVKGAYNGVCKERLLERMKARGIPSRLVKWVDAFCSERTASVVVNGHTSEQQALAQAGLPQGSPLSPVAFLFFNADLVQRRISNNSGSIAFVDDYSAWVTGPTAESNRDGIQSIIDDALEWEKRSGATGNDVKPKDNVKLLGVIMDQALRFKEHIAGMASPRTARQLFTATVAPTMDYASNRVGAQAITGGGVEILDQNADAAEDASLTSLKLKLNRRYASPMQKLASAMERLDTKRLETIHEFALAPWDDRVQVTYETNRVEVLKSDDPEDITIATSSSQRKGKVGLGGVVRDALLNSADEVLASYSVTLGSSDEQNAYTAGLEAIATALRCVPRPS
ncbi:endonuclease-reverse transcriptase domain-containing protein [Hirsutella rhossiliensis]|uniref:Endonuclease-reverse transcriptase domain-containing protein n=1 Tax=Hirsutella rhossiliensis TaxID=111463 RepID=A0A9P8SGK5_9HYPO|nr:endonuclease-reverse transcriptase domain-containing protein [Hirsutella rhossiliensis]KAH0961219.1 endonuclease-reverse transcriptase domain-containing protein [Hirsutella rhossiliensis]